MPQTLESLDWNRSFWEISAISFICILYKSAEDKFVLGGFIQSPREDTDNEFTIDDWIQSIRNCQLWLSVVIKF